MKLSRWLLFASTLSWFSSSLAQQRESSLRFKADFTGQIVKLELYNADTDVKILDLSNGTVVTSTNPSLSVNAIVSGSGIKSVLFGYNSTTRYSVENKAPYALCSNKRKDFKPCPILTTYGSHTVIATPFARKGATGTSSKPYTITFYIVRPGESIPTGTPGAVPPSDSAAIPPASRPVETLPIIPTPPTVTATPPMAVAMPGMMPIPIGPPRETPMGAPSACSTQILDYLNNIRLSANPIEVFGPSAEDRAATFIMQNDRGRLSPCTEQGQWRLRQRLATLAYIYQGWNGFTPSPPGDECQWPGVVCNSGGVVTSIGFYSRFYISNQNTLPMNLGLLTGMQYFAADGSYGDSTGYGTLPTTLGLWTSLIAFSIRNNRFNGTLPDFMGSWTSLQYLDVSSNLFTGPVPTSILNWTSTIKYGWFENNNFVGAIPSRDGFCPKTDPNVYFLADCSVSSPEVDCPCCDACYVAPPPTRRPTYAPFSYPIPPPFSPFSPWSPSPPSPPWSPSVKVPPPKGVPVSVPSVWAPGAVSPSTPSFGNPTSIAPSPPCPLSIIDFINNITLSGKLIQLNGTTPEDKAATYLTEVDGNLFKPCSDEGRMRLQQRFAILTARFQEQYLNVSNIYLFPRTDECQWVFVSCQRPASVTKFHWGSYGGSFPADLGLLTRLESFYWYGNRINGTLPSSIGLLTSLREFHSPNKGLTGSLPSSIGSWKLLQTIDLYGNGLTGEIPTSIANWTDIGYANFGSNNFTGSMPFRAGECPKTNPNVFFQADCSGPMPEVDCPCCDNCISVSPVSIPAPWSPSSPVYPSPTINFPPSPPCPISIIEFLNSITLSGRLITLDGSLPEDRAAKYMTLRDTDVFKPCTDSGKASLQQRFAILIDRFQDPTIDPSVGFFGWNECLWSGISCKNGTVTRFYAGYYEYYLRSGIGGTFPTDLALLSRLEELYISNIGMRGTLPSSIGLWSSLRFFDVSNNFLTGTIPKSIVNWQNTGTIRTANFRFNNLTGVMPFRDGFCPRRPKSGSSNNAYFAADCYGPTPEVECLCCSYCTLPSPPPVPTSPSNPIYFTPSSPSIFYLPSNPIYFTPSPPSNPIYLPPTSPVIFYSPLSPSNPIYFTPSSPSINYSPSNPSNPIYFTPSSPSIVYSPSNPTYRYSTPSTP